MTEKKVTFFHLGESSITHAEGVARPKKTFSVSEEEGKKLKRLYPKILQTVGEATAHFEKPAPAPAPQGLNPTTPAEKTPEELQEDADAEEAAKAAQAALEKEADERGMTVEDLKALKELEAEEAAKNAGTGF